MGLLSGNDLWLDRDVRRLNDYPDLLKKHFSTFTIRRLEETMPDAVADRVIERLTTAKTAIDPNDREQAPPTQT